MNSLPITDVFGTIQKCSRSPNNKKDEIIIIISKKGESSLDCKRRRRVAFDDRVRVFDIHTRADYTNDEVRAYWYSRSELKLFRSDCCTIAKAPRTAFLKNTGEDCCSRGLEHLTSLTCKNRKLDIAKAMFAVFIEQEMHSSWTAGGAPSTPPDELIRKTYVAQSRRSKVNARLKGLSDEAEAASNDVKNHVKVVCSNRIVRGSSRKGWLFQQKVAEMLKTSSKSNAKRRRHLLPHQ